MSDKLYTAYGEDKILDLENENVTEAFKDAIGGGGSGGVEVYEVDPITEELNTNYATLKANLDAGILSVAKTEENGVYGLTYLVLLGENSGTYIAGFVSFSGRSSRITSFIATNIEDNMKTPSAPSPESGSGRES